MLSQDDVGRVLRRFIRLPGVLESARIAVGVSVDVELGVLTVAALAGAGAAALRSSSSLQSDLAAAILAP